MFVVDGGDWAWKSSGLSEARLTQQRLKGELQASAFAVAGIDAMVPGEGDLALGLDWLSGQVEQHSLPLVAANLSCGGAAPFPASIVIERGGVKLGVIGVLDPSLKAGERDACEVSDAAEAVSAALDGLDANVVLVLSHQPTAQDRLLSEKLPAIDLVLNGHDRIHNTTPRELPGGALQLGSGSRGKHVGVAVLTLIPGAKGFEAEDARRSVAHKLDSLRARAKQASERVDKAREQAAADPSDEKLARAVSRAEKQRDHYAGQVAELEAELAVATEAPSQPRSLLSNTSVDLDTKVPDDPATAALIEAAKPRIDEAGSEAAASVRIGGPFVGSSTCRTCHQVAWAQWKETSHSKAWNSLEKEQRQNDLDCWSCHATGAFTEGGPQQPGEVGHLTDVGCESCHGPGRQHAKDPTGEAGALVVDPPAAVCMRCHDGVQDEGRFDFAEYRPKVVHADDPR